MVMVGGKVKWGYRLGLSRFGRKIWAEDEWIGLLGLRDVGSRGRAQPTPTISLTVPVRTCSSLE